VPQLRIALAQVDATVGDLAGNADLVLDWTRRAASQGARIVVFPEMMLTGYPVEDLALRASFVEASIRALAQLAERLAAEGLPSSSATSTAGPTCSRGWACRRAPRKTQPRCSTTARSW
jgi:predicted amidohydrolase